MTYVPDLIRIKRDGGELDEGQLRALVDGIADGSVSDAQVGALAMAIVLNGMTAAERIALTGAMRDSGDVLDWSGARLPGPALDKHSTGGVGDKVSLLLAPIVAACGGAVPMISGRGLGHTGGTLDKLESIPGYNTTPQPDELRRAVASAGAAIVGQTARLAPADRRLYAIRDATGTVESIPLIVVMDVKVGSGAFLPERERAEELAQATLRRTGRRAAVRVLERARPQAARVLGVYGGAVRGAAVCPYPGGSGRRDRPLPTARRHRRAVREGVVLGRIQADSG
jgi:thymidine phosphorylase